MHRPVASTQRPSARRAKDEFGRLLQRAKAGIRQRRDAIGRTTACLTVVERFLAEGEPWLRLHADAILARRESPASSYAFVDELDGLRDVLDRVGLQVAVESTDLRMDTEKLGRLSTDLQHESTEPESTAREESESAPLFQSLTP